MKNIALIFPGQGAQKVGMGLEFYQTSREAKAIFDEANRVCANELTKVIFDGPEDKLTSTAYCQPAILTTSIAALKAFESHPKYKNCSVKFTAGLSLGEYSALVAAGAISFVDTLRLVQKRASVMEDATKENKGAMAAVIGFDKSKLVEICSLTGAEVANFNSNEQIVITGHAVKVESAIEAIKAAGGQKIIPLAVSGAFHSSLMQPAAEKFKKPLSLAKINSPKFPIVHNVDGRPGSHPEEIRQKLSTQITSSVQWVETIEFMVSQGVGHFIEIGPGKVLTGLIKRINSNLKFFNIETPSDIDKIIF
jgi:[acyl-carrier-protein] S-malonyltransferase